MFSPGVEFGRHFSTSVTGPGKSIHRPIQPRTRNQTHPTSKEWAEMERFAPTCWRRPRHMGKYWTSWACLQNGTLKVLNTTLQHMQSSSDGRSAVVSSSYKCYSNWGHTLKVDPKRHKQLRCFFKICIIKTSLPLPGHVIAICKSHHVNLSKECCNMSHCWPESVWKYLGQILNEKTSHAKSSEYTCSIPDIYQRVTNKQKHKLTSSKASPRDL